MLTTRLVDHARSTPHAFGWLVGDVSGAGRPSVLGSIRCTRISDGLPDWSAEATELASATGSLVPHGLCVVGWYASVNASELGALVHAHSSALRGIIASSALGAAVVAVVPPGASSGAEVSFFHTARLALADGEVALEPMQPPEAADETSTMLHETHVVLRARPLIHLHVPHAKSDGWVVAVRDACSSALEQLLSSRACFAFPCARSLGVVSLEAGAERAAPLANGVCGALSPLDHLEGGGGRDCEEMADEGEVELEDEEDEEELRGGGGAQGKARGSKPKGKKGGGKKGGGKKGRGGGKGPAGGHAESGPGEDTMSGQEGAAAGMQEPGALIGVTMLWPQTPPAAPVGGRLRAPSLTIDPLPHGSRHVSLPIQLDAVVYARREQPLAEALTELQAALASQLERLSSDLAAASTSASCSPPLVSAVGLTARACLFRPEGSPLLCTMTYVLPRGGEALEAAHSATRETAHRRLGLPLDRPLLRSSNALDASNGNGGGGRTPIPGLLTDVHVGLGPSGLKGGQSSLVQGSYEYFHYMQWTGAGQKPEKYDDCGWGCAYRSLQSIISWFRIQGYTSLPNPTHYEIQKTLVDHCGQDPSGLLGKKTWLGSQDLCYYLEYAVGATCRTEVFNSGDDVASGARRLVHHFETQGTPVMIGGGELAFTLLGVDFNERTGEVRYLIMDPHYTGADELRQIQPTWVGWKSADSLTHLNTKLFKSDTFYMFCLPERPNTV